MGGISGRHIHQDLHFPEYSEKLTNGLPFGEFIVVI